MAPLRWAVLPSLAFLAFFTYFTYRYLPFSSPGAAAPGITHIVMFKWKDSADEASISEVSLFSPTLLTHHHPTFDRCPIPLQNPRLPCWTSRRKGPILTPAQATSHFLSLKKRCTHPVYKTPYILSLTGGRDNSPEGLQDGLTHAFVVEFRSVWERDYYVRDDPDHRVFKDSIEKIVDKVVVMDFEPGRFD